MSLETYVALNAPDARERLSKWVAWHKDRGLGEDTPMVFAVSSEDDGRVTRASFRLSDAEAWLATDGDDGR